MLTALRQKVDDEFSRRVLDGAERALGDRDNPLRLNFFCTAMRILFEHSMERLAPTVEVKRSAWFRPERDNGDPTRVQRIKFAVQGGLDDELVRDRLGLDIAPLQQSLNQAINSLSKHIHGREHTVERDGTVQDQMARDMCAVAAEFFDTAAHARAAILTPIEEALDDAAVTALLSETILEIDELASHHSIDEVYVHRVSVHRIDAEFITYRAIGTLSVVLQWGSNSDLRRGDGAEMDQSFPFECDIRVLLDDPWDMHSADTEHRVDTSAWRDAMAPDG